MAKINITRLPNATQEYDPGQFDQMIRLLDQIILILVVLHFWTYKQLEVLQHLNSFTKKA
jgi:hypothetical protein